MNQKALAGQVAVVTGGAKRIGRGIAERLAAEGAAVVVNYRGSKGDAESLVKEIRGRGGRAMAVAADVSRREDVERMLTAVDAEFGRLDILVNNAGVFSAAKFETLTDAEWDAMMDTNLKAHMLTAQAAAPRMRKVGRGVIVNITSLGGLLAWPAFVPYCVSKAGAIMLTRCLARLLAPEIRVNSVAPGTIQFSGEAPDQDYIRRAPLKKTGTAEDIAGAVMFLIENEFVTGQVIVVDGGRSLT